ncbi:unnamed protein product [Caenorhabditis bovis]|uniref:Edg1 TPR repeats region domain-containing protein n=1 Tax=Caenorhabditis bovis TaxID=2654633 RepID=A0A8S1F3I4_9PELO|nr:unnamed protein product [Caenorhabditis bovis]
MTSTSENSLRDIEKFRASVRCAFDLYETSSALLSYAFGPRELIDVVQRACEDESLVKQCTELLLNVVDWLNEEITVMASKMEQVGLTSAEFGEFRERLILLYEVDRAVNACDDLITSEMQEMLNSTIDAVLSAYQSTKSHDVSQWKRLKTPYYQFFTKQSSTLSQENLASPPQIYAREDGVVSSIAFEKARNDVDGKKCVFVSRLVRILNGIRADAKFDIEGMREIVAASATFTIDDRDAEEIFDRFLSVWDSTLELKKRDEPYLFVEMLRKFFAQLSPTKKNAIAGMLLAKYNETEHLLPNLENFIRNYQQQLTELLNRLPHDHQKLTTEADKFEELKNQMAWFLLATPVTCLHQLLQLCITNKGFVPAVVKVCRAIPVLFEARVFATNGDDGVEQHTPEPVLIINLRRIFKIGSLNWRSLDEWNNAAYLALSFAKKRKGKLDDDPPLLNPYDLIQLVVEELVRVNNGKHRIGAAIFAKMLSRLFANNANNKEVATYKWATSLNQPKRLIELHPIRIPIPISEDDTVPTPELILLLYDILMENDGHETSEHCRDTIRSIGFRLEEEQIRFDDETIEFFAMKRFNNGQWWIKYSIFVWLNYALNSPKLQVPSGIYTALAESENDDFEPIISSEQSSAAECYLRSLFELGLFDVELAIELVNRGFDVRLDEDESVHRMAMALVDCYGKKFSQKKASAQIAELLRRMLDVFDPTRFFKRLESWSASMFEGLKSIDHLLLLSRAVKIAFERKNSMFVRDTSAIPARGFEEIEGVEQIATQLLDVFCETSKKLIDDEYISVSQYREETRKALFETKEARPEIWKMKALLERREQKLMFQMNAIFEEAVCFTRQMQQIPTKLHILLVTIVEKMPLMQKFATNKVLDEMITEKSTKQTVYAYAQSLPPPIAEPAESTTTVEPMVRAQCGVDGDDRVAACSKSSAEQQVARNTVVVKPQMQQQQQHSVENRMFNNGANNFSSRRSQQQPQQQQQQSENHYSRNETSSRHHYRNPAASGYRNRSRQRNSLKDPHNLYASDREAFNRRQREFSGGSRHNSYRSNDFYENDDDGYSQYHNSTYREYDKYQESKSGYKSRNAKPFSDIPKEMTINPYMLLLLLPLLFAGRTSSITIDEMLVTNKYMFISQHGCITQFEAEISPGLCPQVMQKPPASIKSCSSDNRIHLLRDLDGVHAPKLGMFASSDNRRGQVVFRVFNLNETGMWNSGMTNRKYGYYVHPEYSSSSVIMTFPVEFNDISTIYDPMQRLMYVFYTLPGPESRGIVEFHYLRGLFDENDKPLMLPMTRTVGFGMGKLNMHIRNSQRFAWTEDAYTRRVFYKEIVDGKLVTFMVPMDSIMSTFIDGAAGKRIASTEENRDFYAINGGINAYRVVEDGSSIVKTYFSPTNSSLTTKGMTCSHETDSKTLSWMTSLLVIRDRDYCLLKYASQAKREMCEHERLDWLEMNGLLDRTEEDTVKWLIITIVILLMIIVLLLVYVYWLRSTFAAPDDRIAQNEYEQEASLFVSKQRSFPSVYPDPALLDVSVDKWN